MPRKLIIIPILFILVTFANIFVAQDKANNIDKSIGGILSYMRC